MNCFALTFLYFLLYIKKMTIDPINGAMTHVERQRRFMAKVRADPVRYAKYRQARCKITARQYRARTSHLTREQHAMILLRQKLYYRWVAKPRRQKSALFVSAFKKEDGDCVRGNSKPCRNSKKVLPGAEELQGQMALHDV